MSGRPVQTKPLAQAGRALENLLVTLLAEVPEHTQASPRVDTEAPETGPRSPAAVPEAPHISPPLPVGTETAPAETSNTARPGWAEGDLKVLVVHIGDLRLAVPLARLAGITRPASGEAVVRLPAQPAWHAGVESFRGQQMVRVDPVALLGLATVRQDCGYLLVIGDGRFALEVDAIGEPLSVDAGAIHWRRQGDGRDWVPGVLPEQMTLVLDPDRIVTRLVTVLDESGHE